MHDSTGGRPTRRQALGSRMRPGVERLSVAACASVLVGVLVAAGCQDSSAAQRRTEPRKTLTGYLPPDGAKTFTLEFEAPDDMLQRRPDGSFVVTAFQVGFFDGANLVQAIEIPRSVAEFSGKNVRLPVPMIPLSTAERGTVTVRVRGLSSGPLGPWSDAAGSVTLPVQERERSRRTRDNARDASRDTRRENARASGRDGNRDANRDANREAGRDGGSPDGGRAGARPERERRADAGDRARARRVTLEELNGAPALKQALAPLLRGASEEETAAGCATLQDLGIAVVLSRKHDVPLAPLCAAQRERNDGALAQALTTLKKDAVNAPREIRTARAEARELIRGAKRP